jgi:hypothetical protein
MAFAYRVMIFSGYDINGYCFRTTSYDQSRPNRKTMCSGVFTPGLDEVKYYGRIEEIHELSKKDARTMSLTRYQYLQLNTEH